MNIGYIVATLIIIIISVSLSIKLHFKYDLLKNIGLIEIKLYGIIPLLISRITLIGEYLNFTPEKENVIPIKIELNNINIEYFNRLIGKIKHKLYSSYLCTHAVISIQDASLSAIVSSLINVSVSILYSKISANNKDIKLEKYIQTGFRHNLIIADISYKFRITLFDFMWTAINTIIIIRKEIRNERQRQQKQQEQQEQQEQAK